MEKKNGASRFHFDNLFLSSPKPCGKFRLYQLGELYCSERTEVAEHDQYCYEFTFVLEGKGTLYTDGKGERIAADDCVWSDKGSRHAILSDETAPLRFCYAAYDTDEESIQNVHRVMRERGAGGKPTRTPSLRDLFSRLLDEIEREDDLVPHAIDAALSSLIISVFRARLGDARAAYRFDRPSKSYVAYRAANYIDAHICDMKSLGELSSALHYNYQYLARSFRAVMKQTLSAYFTAKKMERAATLLRESGMSAGAVAEKLNYSCPQAFTLAFTRHFRMTPSAYKKGDFLP